MRCSPFASALFQGKWTAARAGADRTDFLLLRNLPGLNGAESGSLALVATLACACRHIRLLPDHAPARKPASSIRTPALFNFNPPAWRPERKAILREFRAAM